jgi:molybdate transport system substrate-binding protein
VVTLAFVSAGAAEGLVRAFAAQSGVAIEGRFGAVGAMLEALEAGENADVVILTRKQVASLAARARVLAASVADLGTVATAIAVRSADNPPDISSAEALRAALLAADAIHFPDPAKATAGIHFADVLDRLGLAEALAGRLRTHPNGRTAMRALAESVGNPIGCTQATEILATPGLTLVGALPRGYSLDTVYSAAVDARSTNTQAGDFVRRLTGKEERERRAAAGFR